MDNRTNNHPNRSRAADDRRRLAALLNRVENMREDVAERMVSDDEARLLADNAELVEWTGERYRLTAEGKRFARFNDPRPDNNPIANELYRRIYKIAGLDDKSAIEAASKGGLDVSRSRVNGWRKHPADRLHAKMTLEELLAVLDGILAMDEEDESSEQK
jgi:hypothetical protein